MGCQRKIASQIVARGGDYILQVKGNQPKLYEKLEKLFIGTETGGYAHTHCDTAAQSAKGHGRIETRQCFVVSDDEWLLYLQQDPNKPRWDGLRSVVKMVRRHDSDSALETSYYITSLVADADQMMAHIRGHWGIENSLHWVLDMAYRKTSHAVASTTLRRTSAFSATSRSTFSSRRPASG